MQRRRGRKGGSDEAVAVAIDVRGEDVGHDDVVGDVAVPEGRPVMTAEGAPHEGKRTPT